MPQASSAHRALLLCVARRFSDRRPLTAADLAIIEGLQGAETVHRRGADVTGASQPAPQLIVKGWACETRPLIKGGRQIFRFLLPGDFIGSFWPRSSGGACQVLSLTRLELLDAGELTARDAAGVTVHAAIVDAGRQVEDDSQGLLFDHMVRLGARDAYCGLSHLLLELQDRAMHAGLAEDGGFPLPIGQRVLAQALGLTPAHVNHTLQRMRADGLIEAAGSAMRLLARDRMAALSDYASRGRGVGQP